MILKFGFVSNRSHAKGKKINYFKNVKINEEKKSQDEKEPDHKILLLFVQASSGGSNKPVSSEYRQAVKAPTSLSPQSLSF